MQLPGISAAASAETPGLWAALRRELRIGERGSLRAFLIRSASGSFALQVASTLLRMATGVLLARAMGASAFGTYAYVFAWIELLKLPTTLGLPILVTREVAAYCARKDWAHLRGLLVRANQAVLGMSLALMLLAGALTWLLADRIQNPHLAPTFWLALLLLPILGLESLRGACLAGLQRVLLAQIPGILVRPVVLLGPLAAIWWLGGQPLMPELVMSLQVVSGVCAFALGTAWLLRSLPREVKTTPPAYQTRAWIGGCASFLLMGGLLLINSQVDIIMLGWLRQPAEVGVYRVVGVCAGLVAFAFGATCGILFPTLARLHAEAKLPQLQRLLTRVSRAVLLFSLPAFLALACFGGTILALVFGQEYAVGSTALAILAVGQFSLSAMGFAGQVLTASGYAREVATRVAVLATLNAALNALLIPAWGINGAALATSLSLVIWNVLLTTLAYRRLGLHAGPFRLPWLGARHATSP